MTATAGYGGPTAEGDDPAGGQASRVSGFEMASSRFGSSLRSPTAAAALLRARAAAAGAQIVPASPIDLVAAVIGAEGWMAAFATDSLAVPVKHGDVAVNTLAAVLTRASGLAEVHEAPVLAAASNEARTLRRLEQLAVWADHMVGAQAPEALRRAAGDLRVGCGDQRIEAVVGTLTIIADTLEAGKLDGGDRR